MQKILLLEDNLALSSTIAYSLATPELKVLKATSLAEAYELLAKEKFDLAIIDRLVADGDGLELVDYIFQEINQLKVLIISHKSQLSDRLLGLRAGAFDYLAKPLHFEELRLKTNYFLTLAQNAKTQLLKFGKIRLDQSSGMVYVDNFRSQLRKREAELLASLIRYRNYVMSRERMISLVWGQAEEPPLYSTLDVYIRRLRIKLGPAANQLKTVRGFGYKLTEN